MLMSFNLIAGEMVVLKKGQPAPFDGIISDAKQMKEFRQLKENNKNLKKVKLKLEDLAYVRDRKIKFFEQESDQYRTSLRRTQFRSFWSNIGYFTLGVIVSGLASKAAMETIR